MSEMDVQASQEYVDRMVEAAAGGKVDKVDGKGLSPREFTEEEKRKLAGIEAGAQKNVAVGWSAVSGRPEKFPPATHAHRIEEVDGLAEKLSPEGVGALPKDGGELGVQGEKAGVLVLAATYTDAPSIEMNQSFASAGSISVPDSAMYAQSGNGPRASIKKGGREVATEEQVLELKKRLDELGAADIGALGGSGSQSISADADGNPGQLVVSGSMDRAEIHVEAGATNGGLLEVHDAVNGGGEKAEVVVGDVRVRETISVLKDAAEGYASRSGTAYVALNQSVQRVNVAGGTLEIAAPSALPGHARDWVVDVVNSSADTDCIVSFPPNSLFAKDFEKKAAAGCLTSFIISETGGGGLFKVAKCEFHAEA